MQWKKWPRWLRDTLSVVGAMAVVLVIYDALMVKNVNWALVPLQIIVALLAVGAWSYISYRNQAKRKQAAAAKAAADKERAAQRQAAKAAAEQQAAVTRERNLSRNQQHQQRQHRD